MPEYDHFARLGLPRRFALNAAVLEREYLARSREVHPDHAGDRALDASARLNEAYAVLKDPFRRTEYLLNLAGGPSAAAVTKPPAEFLEEMLELRFAIEEARFDPDARVEMQMQLERRRDAMLAEVGAALDEPMPDLADLRERLNAVKFINGLLRDLSED